jgi:hypothetical protein
MGLKFSKRNSPVPHVKNNKLLDADILETFWSSIDTGNATLLKTVVHMVDPNDEESFHELPLIYAAHMG